MMLMIVLGLTITVQAQKEKEAPKPNLNKALNFVRQGKFDEAKAIADGIPTHSKTMDDPKAWFHRGIVYAAMDTSSKYTGGAKDNTKVAGEAFDKAFTLAGPKAAELSVIDNGLPMTIVEVVSAFNRKFLIGGDKFFKEDKFKEAVEQFEKGIGMSPKDTSLYQYAGYAAYNADDLDKAILFIGKYFEYGGRNEQAANLKVGALFEFKKDYEQAVTNAREMIKYYPNNVNFRKIELNSLIQLKRYQEATDNLRDELKADPKDVESHYLMGALYEELKDRAEAKKYFEAAFTLDPKHLNSGLAVAKIKDLEGYRKTKSEMDALDYKKDKAKLEVLDKEYLTKLSESINNWETLEKLDPNNQDIMGNLYLLYGNLEMKEKLAKIVSRMKANGMEVD